MGLHHCPTFHRNQYPPTSKLFQAPCWADGTSSLSNIPSQSVSANFQTFPSTLLGRWDFITVQHSIAISIRQLPNFSKHLVGQMGFHHLLLGRTTSNFSLVLLQTVEDLVVLWFVLCHHPSKLVNALVNANSAGHHRIVKDASSNHRLAVRLFVLVLG